MVSTDGRFLQSDTMDNVDGTTSATLAVYTDTANHPGIINTYMTGHVRTRTCAISIPRLEHCRIPRQLDSPGRKWRLINCSGEGRWTTESGYFRSTLYSELKAGDGELAGRPPLLPRTATVIRERGHWERTPILRARPRITCGTHGSPAIGCLKFGLLIPTLRVARVDR